MKKLIMTFNLLIIASIAFFLIYQNKPYHIKISKTTEKEALVFLQKESLDISIPTNSSEIKRQNKDIDEADFIKQDEKYLYYINYFGMTIIELESDKIKQKMEFKDFYPIELLDTKDNLILIGTKSDITEIEIELGRSFPYQSYELSMLIISKTSFNVDRKIAFENCFYQSSRIKDNKIYLVLNSYDILNKESKTLYYPKYHDSIFGEARLSFKDLYLAKDGNNLPTLNLLAIIDLNLNEKIKIKGLLGTSGTVFMNDEGLVLISYLYDKNPKIAFHFFQLDDLSYSGSISLEGYLANNHCFDIYNGLFHVAITKRDNAKYVNCLYNIDIKALKILSFLEFGKNENIYGITFEKQMCYVTTFLNTDPFSSYSFEDSKKIKKVSTVEPTFINEYLTMENNNIFAIGRTYTDDLRVTGMVFGLYSKNDLELLSSFQIPILQNEYINTEVIYNEKALTLFENKYIIPVNINDKNYLYFISIGDKIEYEKKFEVEEYIRRNYIINQKLYIVGSDKLLVYNIENNDFIREIKIV